MKKLLIFIVGVIAIVAVCDIVFGTAADNYVRTHQIPGDYVGIEHLLKEADEDVVVIGSSVALNSLVPKVITDSTGLSCYNGGSNGQEFTYYYTMTDCLLRRHCPKLIVLGFTMESLCGTGIGSRYNILSPYYGMGYNVIDSCMNSESAYSRYFLKSNLYRYNTIWWRILLYHFITPGEPGENGFVAKSVPRFFPEMHQMKNPGPVSEQRMREFRSLLDLCERKGVKVIVFIPPVYKTYADSVPEPAQAAIDECRRRGVACYYDAQSDFYLLRQKLFYDDTHLNKNGAYLYTRQFIERIKDEMK